MQKQCPRRRGIEGRGSAFNAGGDANQGVTGRGEGAVNETQVVAGGSPD